MSHNLCVLGIDAGGTFFKSCLVDSNGQVIQDTSYKRRVDPDGEAGAILQDYAAVIRDGEERAKKLGRRLLGIGISTPGPFDYEGKKSLMTHKLCGIYGLNLEREFAAYGVGVGLPLYFLHDSHAFLLGEHFAGEAKPYQNCAAVTIGTGTGFALIKNGRLLTSEQGGPYISIYQMPIQGETVEYFVSRSGMLRYYEKLLGGPAAPGIDVRELELLALNENDLLARAVFEHTGSILAQAIADILKEQQTECLVLGGQIAKGYPLMRESMGQWLGEIASLKKVTVAHSIDFAAQIGAACMVYSKISGKY